MILVFSGKYSQYLLINKVSACLLVYCCIFLQTNITDRSECNLFGCSGTLIIYHCYGHHHHHVTRRLPITVRIWIQWGLALGYLINADNVVMVGSRILGGSILVKFRTICLKLWFIMRIGSNLKSFVSPQIIQCNPLLYFELRKLYTWAIWSSNKFCQA